MRKHSPRTKKTWPPSHSPQLWTPLGLYVGHSFPSEGPAHSGGPLRQRTAVACQRAVLIFVQIGTNPLKSWYQQNFKKLKSKNIYNNIFQLLKTIKTSIKLFLMCCLCLTGIKEKFLRKKKSVQNARVAGF